MGIKKVFGELLDIAFPRKCDACQATNFGGEFSSLCPECAEKIFVMKSGRCLVCSELLGLNAPDAEGCPHCLENPPAFGHSRVVCSYEGSGKILAESLKYHADLRVSRDMARLARRVPDLEEFLRDATLVPVPLHWKKRLSRGFNQSEIICETLAKRAFPNAGIKIAKLLKRTRHTPSQTALEKPEREKNVRGAFAFAPPVFKKLDKTARLIVVDDVMTTSATLSECARTLKRAGFKNVDAFAFERRL